MGGQAVGGDVPTERIRPLLRICASARVAGDQLGGRDLSMLPYFFVKPFAPNQCWICTSGLRMTREHKIKSTDIRRHFGSEAITLAPTGGSMQPVYLLQSPNAKRLKFSATSCEICNTSATQRADRVYSTFIARAEAYASQDLHPRAVFDKKDLQTGSELYTDLFRYFAKLIGCHIAEIGAPIPMHLARFVLQRNSRNCIWIDIGRDSQFDKIQNVLGNDSPLQYAAHGGIVIVTKPPSLTPIRFVSSRTVGPIGIGFWYNLTLPEQIEMRLRFPDFVEECRNLARAQQANSPHSSR